MAVYVGVDGCRGGWVSAVYRDNEPVRIAVHATAADLHAAYPDAARLLIDMPIGLAESGPRACEKAARQLLGPRRSSVFAPPVRSALYDATYAEASAANQRACGRKLSIQTWHIMPKMREVDTLLRAHPALASVWLEAHPELLFRALAGHPMPHNKKTADGYAERITVLTQYEPDAPDIVAEALRDFRGVLVRDDVVDALCEAVCARMGNLRSLPDPPEYDSAELPMQMVYPALDESGR